MALPTSRLQHSAFSACFITAILLSGLFGEAQQRARPQLDLPTGDSSIRGKLTTTRGQPVWRAKITLHSAQGVATWQASTGSNGEFRFDAIPAGMYFLLLSHPRYVTTSSAEGVARSSRVLTVRPKETLHVDLTAIRGGAITGTIVDRYGEPIPDVSVRPYRYVQRGGRRILVPAESKVYPSNDLGHYRVANLPSGSYVLRTDYSRSDVGPNPPPETGHSGLPETWYPGSRYYESAQSLHVTAGQDLAGVDFFLHPTTFVEVSGTVLDSSGKPVKGAEVLIRPTGQDRAISVGSRSSSTGTFQLQNLQPGDYLLIARTTQASDEEDPEKGVVAHYGETPVSVGSYSVRGVTLHLHPGAKIVGNVRADQPLPSRLVAVLVAADPTTRTQRAPVSSSGDFNAYLGPGVYTVTIRGVPDEWFVERTWLDAMDVSSSPFAISSSSARRLTVQLSSRGATLVGSVAKTPVDPCKECFVAVIADLPDNRAEHAATYTTHTDAKGHFLIKGLPPGTYLAVSLASVSEEVIHDASFASFVQRNGLRLVLTAGEQRQSLVPLAGSYR